MEKEFIVWRNEYSVNIDEIDEQHKVLIRMINELYSAFMNKEHNNKINQIVANMAEYAVNHFSVEEKYFMRFGYADSMNHILEHKSFIEQVSTFQSDLKNNKTTLTFKVMTFLQKWLTNHIIVSDKKYVSCFKENGVI